MPLHSHHPRSSSARVGAPASAAIDRQRFALIAAALDPARAGALCALFAEEACACPTAIRTAVGANDFAAAASEALRLRSAAWALGAEGIGRAADALAQTLRARGGSAPRLVQALRSLDLACAATLPLLADLPIDAAAAPAPEAAFACL